MILSELSTEVLRRRLNGPGVSFRAGRFAVNLRCSQKKVADNLQLMYSQVPLVTEPFADFHIEVRPSGGLRRFYRPNAAFRFNGQAPFAPLPLEQAFALMEWGLNWCISKHFHEQLVFHAAVVEKNGRAVILPGTPGSGKSTLCAALVYGGGWRLLSDELTLLDLENGYLWPNPRPVSLKNESIDLIRRFAPDTVCSDVAKDTIKGTVAHIQPPAESVKAWNRPAEPALILFPEYRAGCVPRLTQLSRGRTFIELANQSFNYSILQETGFNAVGQLLQRCRCYHFEYDGDLDTALVLMDELIDDD